MSKITEFYAKAVADESAKTKLAEILGGKDISEATDEQLEKIGELAEELGFEISFDEAKAYLNPADGVLDDDSLDAVAGGKHNTYIEAKGNVYYTEINCTLAGGNVN